MNKGFSLVELIVVIAIMAILVGVAVPVYTNYIDKAEDGVEAQYVDELERAINTVCIDMKAGLTNVDTETEKYEYVVPTSVKIQGNTVNVTADADASEATTAGNAFETLLEGIIELDADSTVEYTFTITNGTVSAVTNDPRS